MILFQFEFTIYTQAMAIKLNIINGDQLDKFWKHELFFEIWTNNSDEFMETFPQWQIEIVTLPFPMGEWHPLHPKCAISHKNITKNSMNMNILKTFMNPEFEIQICDIKNYVRIWERRPKFGCRKILASKYLRPASPPWKTA